MPIVLGEASALTTAITGAFSAIPPEVTEALSGIAPVAIGIFTMIFAWKMAKKFFKVVANG